MAIEDIFPQGGQSPTTYIVLSDGSGNLVTGLTAADITANYIRPRSSLSSISLSDIGATDSYTSGGFAEVDSTNTPGLYRLDLPTTAIAPGESKVILHIGDDGGGITDGYGSIFLDAFAKAVRGKAVTGTLTTTDFTTDISMATDNIYKDAFVQFTSGNNANVVRLITGSTASNNSIQCDALPNVPADQDEFVIVNR